LKKQGEFGFPESCPFFPGAPSGLLRKSGLRRSLHSCESHIMASFPSLPLFTDAVVADCVHLSDAEFGLYMRILIQTWRNPGCRLPADPIWLARKFQRDYETEILPILNEFFSSTANWWSQKRLSEQHNYVSNKSKKQTERANIRWNKEKDGYHGNAEETACGNAPKPTLKPKPKEEIKENKQRKISFEELSVSHIEPWLTEKRSQGTYIDHDPVAILEKFRNYCQSKGKKYADYVAAYRNAFEWESCQPKSTKQATMQNVRML